MDITTNRREQEPLKTIPKKSYLIDTSSKQSAHEKILEKNTKSRNIYSSVKAFKKKPNDPNLPDPENLNKYLATIGPLIFQKVAMQHKDKKMDNVKNSMVLLNRNETEVTKTIKIMKNQKISGHDGIGNEILKCCSPVCDTVNQ